MDAYTMGKTLGMMTGALIGLIVAAIALKMMNKDKKIKTEYDEMQNIIRGKGYRIAFYAVMILEALLCFTDTGTSLPAEAIVVHFLPIFLGVTVLSVYCIWKDAFVGLNTRLGRYIIFCVFISLINLAAAAAAWRSGDMFIGGKLQAPFVNFLCGLMLAIIGIAGLMKKTMDRGEA